MTNEHDSATAAATSLREKGEVCGAQVLYPHRRTTDANGEPVGVVGGSRSGREGVCEGRRSGGKRPSGRHEVEGCPSEVRATIVALKRGNSRGAKGGRKVNAQ